MESVQVFRGRIYNETTTRVGGDREGMDLKGGGESLTTGKEGDGYWV